MKFSLRFVASVLMFVQTAAFAATGRQTINFDLGWRFVRPETAPQLDASAGTFNDSQWDVVNLPHTVRLEPFDASGGRNYQGVCWYRRHFTPLDEWKDHKLLLRFGAAMQVADVWLNGKHLLTHYGGYLPFTIDLTSDVTFDADNVLAVKLDNSDNAEVPPGKPQNALDFCYFGGLYRNVTLDVTDRLHVSDVMLAAKPAGGGVFVSFSNVSADAATVRVQTDVQNEYANAQTATVKQELLDAQGNIVASGIADVSPAPGTSQADVQTLKVTTPHLWHPNHPYLYTLKTTISQGAAVADVVQTKVGIRTFTMDATKGLSINGEKFVSLGANRHQDHPYVGYALSDQAQRRDLVKLREGGFTSIRSHYPQDEAFVDACDELGMLLIVSNPGWQFAGDEVFTQRVYQDAREMVRRDRNHPCVILWEAQLNESRNNALYATLQKIVHDEYPFAPCYTAGDSVGGQDWDVVYGRNRGNKPLWIREIGDRVDNWSDQQSPVRIMRGWGESAMLTQDWSHVDTFNNAYLTNGSATTRPGIQSTDRLCGIDLWAGVDAYRGYHHQPFLGGPLDLFRIPKFDYYFFQSQRPPDVHVPGLQDGPMVFIANFATFLSPTSVTVFSNCDEVRMSVNGKILATQKPLENYGLPHAPFKFQVGQISTEQSTLFMTGVARPGVRVAELKAEGLIDGKVVATHTVRAPGVPAKLRLEADLCGTDLVADGSDWVRVYAYVTDARGTTHPTANDEITFEVSGPGQIIDDVRIHANPVRAEAGIATVLVRATTIAGKITVRGTGFGLSAAEVTIESKPHH